MGQALALLVVAVFYNHLLMIEPINLLSEFLLFLELWCFRNTVWQKGL
jgi:hypothetical protein